MPRRIKDIDMMAFIIELKDRAGDRNTTLFFDFHPVRYGMFGCLSRFDRASQMYGTSVEEQFFSQCRLASIRVRDDGKRTAVIYFIY